MTTADKTFLHNNRRHYDMWKQAQIVNQLDGATRNEMFAIIRRNFAPHYTADLWCQSCVTAMIEYLYTQYDKWIKENNETSA
jgi:hypothetical protein